MRQLLITILLAFTTLAIFAQTDSTKVKKKKKVDYVTLSGYVADGFTKAAIPDVQVTLMREDSKERLRIIVRHHAILLWHSS